MMGESSSRGEVVSPEVLLRLVGGCFTLVGLFFLVGGVVVFAWLSGQKRLSEESLDWPMVTGTVLESKVHRYTSSGNSENSSVQHVPRIVYEFELGGTRYESHQRSIMGENYESAEAQRIVDAYPVGSAITVYFQPGNPEESVLQRGGSEEQWRIGTGVLIGFLVFSGVALFAGIRMLRRRSVN